MAATLPLQAVDDVVDAGRLRASRGFSVIFRWPALGVVLMRADADDRDDALDVRVVADRSRRPVLQALHLGEGDLGPGLHARAVIEPGVLLRQEAFGHDDVEPDGEHQRARP